VWHAIHDGVTGFHIRSTLVIAYLCASITCAEMMRRYDDMPYKQSLSILVEGAKKMVYIANVLVLAWSLSSITKGLHTAEYVSSLIRGSVSPVLFPLIVFILGAIISLSTGSSYGTFAILMMLAVPVGLDIGASLYVTIAAVLSGGLIGDHVSPISDTTILASLGAGCEHMNHVTTQSAYAAVTGVVTAFTFYLAVYVETPLVLLFMVALLGVGLQTIMRVFGTNDLQDYSDVR
jgi:Na+/H+ antiporter NhaC